LTSVTDRLFALLQTQGVTFQRLEHAPVRTSEEASLVRGTPLEQGAKALVFKADDHMVLLVVQAHRRLDARTFKQTFRVKNLRMIAPEELLEVMGLEVGAVPPFGHLLGLQTYADERLLLLPHISFNAGSRSTSVVMSPVDYARLENPITGLFAGE
jgi:prolyl-tRNA editing enzyme YbaK/EbsC (Cys-tRNA(Pro) deacylase)